MRKLLFLTLFTLAMALLPVLAFRGDLWLSSDFLHQEISFILETKRMFATGAPWWSWNTYLGSDFIGSYAFYTLTSPFVWINCLLPESLLEVGIAITFVLKFLCVAWLSFAYIHKMGVSQENSVLGAFLFTFSSFNIASLYYYHFYEPIIAFLILLIAIERLLRCEKWGMTAVALSAFAVTFVNFYFAIGSFIAALIYVFFRAFSCEINFSIKTAIKGLAAVVVGIIICSFLLLPIFNQMLVTTRADTLSVFDTTAILNIIERLRTLLMPKVVEGTTAFVPRGSASYSNEACIAVFGLALAIIYAWRHRDWLAALLVTFLVLYLTPLNGVFTLFTNPLYTRWAYALTLIIVLCTVLVLDDKKSVKKGVVVYSIIASIVVLAFTAKVVFSVNIPGPRFFALIALFFVGLIALLLWCHVKISTRWLKVGVVGCVVVQMWLFLLNLGTDSLSYNTLINNVENGSGDVCYRSDFRAKKGFLYFNTGLLRNQASIQGYHSVITISVDSLFKIATRDFWAKNKLRANVNQDDFDELLSVRYIYDIDSVGNVAKRDAERFIPFGFTYESYITRSEFNKVFDDTTRNLPKLLLSHLVIEDNDEASFKEVLRHGYVDSVATSKNRVVANEFIGNSRGYKSFVDLAKNEVLFFSVPFACGFTATIDGSPTNIYKANLCLQALKVPQGKHTIVVTYFPPGLKTGVCISVIGLLLLMLILWSDMREKRRNR